MIARVSGHFGEWLQGRLGATGPVVLVTLPCPVIGVTATRVGDGCFGLSSEPPILQEAAGRILLEHLGVDPAGQFELSSDVPPGGGAGVSTACLLALARGARANANPEELAKACLRVEGAVDPLMLDAPDACLWSSREATVVEEFGVPPEAEIIGGFWGAPERTTPEDVDFSDISDLVSPWRNAVASRDLEGIAALAAESAERTTRLRGPNADFTAELAKRFSALGHLRAHTGSARGLIFAPGTAPEGVEAALEDAGFTHVLRFKTAGPR